MSKLSLHKPVKLFVGFIGNDPDVICKAQGMLSGKFGEVDLESPAMDFNFTDYYNDELGDNLKRKFICFKKLIAPEKAYRMKIMTNRVESKFSIRSKRRVNIDPGYISLGNLMLLTGKDHYHRIYIGKGVYAEVTLYYKDKKFRALEWTYPDYKSPVNLDIFLKMRERYLNQLNGAG